MATALIILLLVLLAGWLYVRRQKGQTATAAADHQAESDNTAYHSVSLKFSPTACRAARALQGRRFLASAAPRIPLAECDVKKCECRFAHYKDRRATQDRRTVFTASGHSAASGEVKDERREAEERRDDDDPLS